MKIQKICIVGGGSSGWMTAALLSSKLKNINITLIEPKNNNTLGVGESTLGHFNTYLHYLGLKDKDWMSYCNATYKTSIAFKNFREGNGERFQYPFGNIDRFGYQLPLINFNILQKLYPEYYPPEEFARFVNFNTFLTESKKIIPTTIEGSNYHPTFDTAYHFDADLFGKFLKDKIAIPNGIEYLNGEISECNKISNGNIKSLITQNGDVIEADLFIDCTGFKSLLLEQYMGSDFISFNKSLFNDKALATRIPYRDKRDQMTTYTDCVAMSNGWIWDIPLWNRVGAGYVFSSKYISVKNAENEFREYLSERFTPEIAKEANMKLINIKHGRHEKGWVGNVVGIGLSYGFLEPLESTGLLTTHENILYLHNILQKRNNLVTQIDIDTFNHNVKSDIEVLKNFVEMHYYLSSRQDTPYWRDVTHNPQLGKTNDQYLSLLRREGFNMWEQEDATGEHYIAAGMGFNPCTKERLLRDFQHTFEDTEIYKKLHIEYQAKRKELIQFMEQFPYHYDYLKDEIYNE